MLSPGQRAAPPVPRGEAAFHHESAPLCAPFFATTAFSSCSLYTAFLASRTAKAAGPFYSSHVAPCHASLLAVRCHSSNSNQGSSYIVAGQARQAVQLNSIKITNIAGGIVIDMLQPANPYHVCQLHGYCRSCCLPPGAVWGLAAAPAPWPGAAAPYPPLKLAALPATGAASCRSAAATPCPSTARRRLGLAGALYVLVLLGSSA